MKEQEKSTVGKSSSGGVAAQLGRLIAPEEIADAICFMLANAAVSGQLWVDAGWHAPA